MYKTKRFYAFIQDLLGIVFKTKMRFFGQFRDFLQLFLLLFSAIFRRETLPSLVNETNSNGENFRLFETKSAIFAVYFLFFSYFFTSWNLVFRQIFWFFDVTKNSKMKNFSVFYFFELVKYFFVYKNLYPFRKAHRNSCYFFLLWFTFS